MKPDSGYAMQMRIFSLPNCCRITACLIPACKIAQQAIEKSLKAVLIERGIPLRRTHSINELANILAESDMTFGLTEEDCDLLDSIYLPSKYPLGSVLPDFEPDADVCRQCVRIAERVIELVRQYVDAA